MAPEGIQIAGARGRISGLAESLDAMGPPPDDVSTMLDSANLRRRAEYLEKTGSAKSDLISAYAEYARLLEAALREIAGAQQEIAAMARRKAPAKPRRRRAPEKPARAKKASARTARKAPAKARRKGSARPSRVSKASPRRRR